MKKKKKKIKKPFKDKQSILKAKTREGAPDSWTHFSSKVGYNRPRLYSKTLF